MVSIALLLQLLIVQLLLVSFLAPQNGSRCVSSEEAQHKFFRQQSSCNRPNVEVWLLSIKLPESYY